MIEKVQFQSNFYNQNAFNSHMVLDLCFKLINLFDMLRLLMRYLGNFCGIFAVYAANINIKAVSFFFTLLQVMHR